MSSQSTSTTSNLQDRLISDSELVRFWSKVDRRGSEECWPWKGKAGIKGYGSFNAAGRHILPRSLSYCIANGGIIRTVFITSICGLPNCVNPKHLLLACPPTKVDFSGMSREEFFLTAVRQGEFEIDNEGRIWRIMTRRAGFVFPCQRERAEDDSTPYLMVGISAGSGRVTALAHRVVWTRFHGSIPPGLTINHKNGKKHDNHPDNLELATHQEQRIHALRVLGVKVRAVPRPGSSNPAAKLTDDDVAELFRLRSLGAGVNQLAAKYGIHRATVSRILHGKTWIKGKTNE